MFLRTLCRLRPLIFRVPNKHYACATAVYRSHFAVTSIYQDIAPRIDYNPRRCKKTSTKKSEDDEEEQDWNDDPSLSRDSKVLRFVVPSLRMDLVLKSALSIARNKIEKIFYESKIRVNGKKVLKKSVTVHEGDEIDVIKRVSSKNPDHIYVSRVEILSTTPSQDEEGIVINVRRFKNLLIENYEQPYKPSTADEDN